MLSFMKAIHFILYTYLAIALSACFSSIEDSATTNLPETEKNKINISVTYNGDVSYTRSSRPKLNLSSLRNVASYIISPSLSSCQASSSWITYDPTDSYISIPSNNSKYEYYIKVKNVLNEESECQKKSVIHDNKPPRLVSYPNFLLHSGLQTLQETPRITYSGASDNLSGIKLIEARLVNFDDKSELSTWMQVNSPNEILNLVSPLALGTLYDVEFRISDMAGNVSKFSSPHSFIGTNKVEILASRSPNPGAGRVYTYIDFDNDGDMDVIGINGITGSTKIFENYNNKNFEERMDFPDIVFMKNIQIVDLDQDSLMDILGISNSKIVVLFNEGNSTFTKWQADHAYVPSSVLALNLNSSQRKDIIVSSATNIYNFKQTAPREFEQISIQHNISSGSILLAEAKINNDSYPDFYIGTSSNTVRFLVNSGDNINFSSITQAVAASTSVSILDYNSDGFTDFAVFTSSNTNQKLFLNNFVASPSFNEINFNLSLNGEDIYMLKAMHIDSNTLVDLKAQFTSASYLKNLGGSPNYFSKEVWLGKDPCYDLVDMNLDGKKDLFCSRTPAVLLYSSFYVQYNNGDDTFTNKLATSRYYSNWFVDVNVSDMDGDGGQEISIFDNSGAASVFKLDPLENKFYNAYSMMTGNTAMELDSVDRQNNGKKDLLAVTRSYILHFSYDATTGWPQDYAILAESSDPQSVRAGQASASDSYEDFLVTAHGSDKVLVFSNTTGAGFNKSTLDSGYKSYGAMFYDVNSDTHPDVLATGYSTNEIYLYTNNGSDTYTKSSLGFGALGCTTPYAIEAFRIGADAYTDYIVIEVFMTFTRNAYLYQSTDGTYTRRLLGSIDVGANNSHSYKLKDYDSDGDLDLLTAFGGAIFIYRNNGTTLGNAELLHTIGDTINAFEFKDVNGDGASEFVISRQDEVFVFYP